MAGKDKDGTPIPFGRLSRMVGLGGMAANIAGGMMIDSAQQLLSGKRPKFEDLLLTPSNALKVTQRLSQMRGAAMKIGQLLSMDSGDILPQELADILAQLRAEARHMPRRQLDKVLSSEWGEDWQSKFKLFEFRPIAAASIGQVHRAELTGGHILAIKVQYPGVQDSIDSDIKNVIGLVKMTGLLPDTLDIKPLTEAATEQLHDEADYIREARYLARFQELLNGDPEFVVPELYPDLSTGKILAMSYIGGTPIENMRAAPQETRDRIVSRLADLVMRELFIFKVMQTDPNFANYQYDTETDRIVLLDFGASRDISAAISDTYLTLMRAMLSRDREQVLNTMQTAGFLPSDIPGQYRTAILDIIDIAMEPLAEDAPFDFGDNRIAERIKDKSMALAGKRELWHLPPPELAFIQRKLGGVYLLATRLKAKANIRALLKSYVPRDM